ncbi:unnamed protein product [Clonostachys chloroleuca]|uniref:Uncharacterized protein n=1 Tax=Clonostachys chloroleuca TaxID=1926264 RepID=A0AA35LXV5_9HYPO|nr:unnamed protein product [Clonostachys chloroleuca]
MGVADEPQNAPGPSRPVGRRGFIQQEIIDLIVPPLRVGGWCGAAGAMTGIGAAILQDASPAISGIMTGTHWAALGGSYWFSRTVIIRAAWGREENLTPLNKVTASALAGLPSGALLGLTRTRTIPSSMILCSIMTASGQAIANHFSGRKAEKDEDDSWLRSKWSPLKKLNDQEYVDMMEEKMLRVDADIALIDERIAQLREAQENEK